MRERVGGVSKERRRYRLRRKLGVRRKKMIIYEQLIMNEKTGREKRARWGGVSKIPLSFHFKNTSRGVSHH